MQGSEKRQMLTERTSDVKMVHEEMLRVMMELRSRERCWYAEDYVVAESIGGQRKGGRTLTASSERSRKA